ncbi:GNAT family N-acetyltransferase [Aurantiacibacter gangjinensis]|uniref:GNAT family acetyltransferase n=1 Tax=Aurantiacibacter gangjinensis TaxID=502682 RepID=A0A0G9MN40_9SPHN|nr:GNAT family N-acetyltransferase [Aurantiacibacter gangjinensis]APE28218.1 50S ribosomal protein acetyltransferase [Aurantiacibacter gangjinensis]KLE32116.1 GNAT family acetyltransferase [Aurantiacibacter gangjinensis]
MFIRTDRLFLRPAWSEDAAAILDGIAEREIVRNLARAPWPYEMDDARAFASIAQDPRVPHFLIHLPDAGVIGSVGFGLDGEDVEIGYWIARAYWGQGIATEAGRGLLAIGRMLGHTRLVAGHFADNPASGAVLRKLGFRATGSVVMRHSLARGGDAPLVQYACSLTEER